MASTPSIDPRSDGIGHAIADKKPAVPTRQRHYAWTKEQVNQLFEDLEDAIDNNDEDYFLGLVVVAENQSSRPEVVDGQQRLATCVMLLAAIRDYLLAHTPDKNSADTYESQYLIGWDPKKKEFVPRLKLNIDDAEFFTNFVLRRADTPERIKASEIPIKKLRESNRNIRIAAEIARERVGTIVRGVAKDKHTERLEAWVDFLHSQARVIWFSVPDKEHAYRIFETLNDRGLDLSKSDLLKNYLLEEAGERESEVYQNWSKMIGILESVSHSETPATYVRHLWISLHGPTRDKELFKKIKGAVKGQGRAVELSKQLAESATLYAALLNSDHEHWRGLGQNAKRDIATLIMFKAERIRPLVMAAAQHFEPNEMKKALRLFVACTVRFVIAGGVAGTMERSYGELAKAISDGEIDEARQLAKRLGGIVPNDKEFEAAFANAKVSKASLARYYLRVLEAVRRGDDDSSALSVDESEEKANLEHVLPLNPSPAWGLESKEGQAFVAEYVKRIGNLALMRNRSNQEAGSADFGEKVESYKNEKGLYLTSDLAKRTSWGAKEIEERQQEMAKLAVSGWTLKV